MKLCNTVLLQDEMETELYTKTTREILDLLEEEFLVELEHFYTIVHQEVTDEQE